MVLELGSVIRQTFQHPAAQMAVFLIRDPEDVIEPRLPNHVVGAIVIQHSARTYLHDFEELYSPFLRELAGLTSRTMRAAASKSLISILRRGEIKAELADDFKDKVASVVNWIADGKEATWVLLQPYGNDFKMEKSANDLDGLQQVLIELIGAEKSLHDETRLAAFVCNSTMTFQSPMLHYSMQDIQVGRVGLTEFGANAYFQDDFNREVAELKLRHENRVVFNLGQHELWWAAEQRLDGKRRRVAFVIGTIVSPTGLPIGVLAVLRQVDASRRPWDLKLLKKFEKKLAIIRDDLYASHLTLKGKVDHGSREVGSP